jgi:predicted kinase
MGSCVDTGVAFSISRGAKSDAEHRIPSTGRRAPIGTSVCGMDTESQDAHLSVRADDASGQAVPVPHRSVLAFVVVSGPPGSGKSILASGLASRLELPLFSKDTIKEALMDALGAADMEASRRLGSASIETLLALAHENGRGILESNWRASVSAEALGNLPGPVVEVFCDCAPHVSRLRYADRRDRHPGHFDAARINDDSLWSGEASRPVGGGWPVVVVDTSAPVDLDAVCGQIVAVAATT